MTGTAIPGVTVARDRGGSTPVPALLWPALAYFALLYVLPIGQLLTLSIWESRAGWTAEHFTRLIQVSLYRDVLINTIEISILVAVLAVALGYPAAYLIETGSRRRARLLLIFVIIPFFTSLLVRNYAWIFLLGNRGVINSTLLLLGLVEQPLPLMFNRFGVVLGMTHILLPFSVLVQVAVMRGIDARIVAAASSLAAGPFTAFRRVFLPLSLSGVVGAFLLVFVLALAFFVTPAMLGGPGDIMIANLIASEMGQLNWNFAAALGVVLLTFTLIVIIGIQMLFGATSFAERSFSPRRSFWRFSAIQLRWPMLIDRGINPLWPHVTPLLGGAVLAFLLLPILVMIPLSFNSAAFFVFPPPGFSLQWYRSFVESPGWISALGNSLAIGCIATALTMLLAIPSALVISRSNHWLVTAIYAFLLSPMVIPGIIIAVGLFFFLSPIGLTGTRTGVALGHVIGGLPVALVVLVTALRNFDRDLERASLSLGVNPFWTTVKVVLPVTSTAVCVAAFLAFLHSFDELLIALFISGIRTATLPKKMWESLQEIDPTITAVSTLLILFIIVSLGLSAALQAWGARRIVKE